MRPVIGITMGDAAGIGPEIVRTVLDRTDVYRICRPIVIGDAKILERAGGLVESSSSVRPVDDVEGARFESGTVDCIDLDLVPADLPYGKISAEAGDAAYRFLVRAIDLAKEDAIDAICTAPLNKEALHAGGHPYPGHTEILARETGTEDYAMMLVTPELKVIHLTTHVGLRAAIEQIDPERTHRVIRLAHETLSRSDGEAPRIGVCGINPHAGEDGLFGEGEEETKLRPGIARARAEGIDVEGPLPADTLFFRTVRGDFDVVVACYHDQGHAPVKVLGLEEGVNVTVGLKGGVVRTSVDHGTAFDIAGTGRADDRSLLAALRTAVELSGGASEREDTAPAG